MSNTKTYIMVVMPLTEDNAFEEIDLVRFLSGKDASMIHGGDYNEYVFYTAKLTDEEFIYAALKFGPTVRFLEGKHESLNDIIIRLFHAGHDPKLPS